MGEGGRALNWSEDWRLKAAAPRPAPEANRHTEGREQAPAVQDGGVKPPLQRGEDFVAEGDLSGFSESSGDGAVFLLTEGDGVADGFFVEWAAGGVAATQFVEEFELDPDGRRRGGAFAGDDDFEGVELLAFLGEDTHDVGGGASAESDEKHLHGARRRVGAAVGIERNAVAGGSLAEEFFVAEPADMSGLHEASVGEGEA